MALGIHHGEAVVFAFASEDSKGDEAWSSRLATKFALAAAEPNFARRAQGVKGGINAAVCAAKGTAENCLILVNSVFHAHD